MLSHTTSHPPSVASQAPSCSTLKHWPQLTYRPPSYRAISDLTKHNLTGEIEGCRGQEDWEGKNREVQQTKDGCQGCQGKIQREGKKERRFNEFTEKIYPSLVQASRESSQVWCRRGIRIWRWGGRLWAQQESGAGSNGPSVEILTKCVHLFIFYFFRSQSVGREGNVGSNGCSNPKFGQDKVLVTRFSPGMLINSLLFKISFNIQIFLMSNLGYPKYIWISGFFSSW